jgi:hypothetical protein
MKKIFTLMSVCFLIWHANGSAQTNLNFENWTGNEPNGWSSTNSITQPSGGDASVFKYSTDPAQGSFSVRMVTGDCPECPNFSILGPFGPPTPLPNPFGGGIQLGSFENPGIPYTQKPISVDFRYKANPGANDACGFQVELTRYNPGTDEDETVGEGYFVVSTEVPDWTTVNIPIVYYSNLTPDRLNIWATSSIGSIPDLSALGVPDLPIPDPVAGSEFFIDAIVLNLPSCEGFSIAVSGTAETGLGANNGTATVTTNGGTPPFTYTWSNLETTQSIDGLIPGPYVVTVTDANGCQKVGTYNVSIGGCNLSVNISGTNSSTNSIFTGNGSVTASVSGGNPPYTYTWNTGETGATISNLPVGTYAVLITEQNNPLCAVWGYYTVYGPNGAPVHISELPNDYSAAVAFPNPTDAHITIQSDQEIVRVVITNPFGQQVVSKNITTDRFVFDTTSLASGLYLYSLELIDGTHTGGKFLKK